MGGIPGKNDSLAIPVLSSGVAAYHTGGIKALFFLLQEMTPRALPVGYFSTSGKWAFLIALLFVFSISIEYRLSVAGLLMHPYLLALPLALLISKSNMRQLPNPVVIPLIAFVLIFSIASLRNTAPFSEIFKVGAAVLTFAFFATAIKSETDFRSACWGFLLCGLAIGIRGFLKSEEQDISRLSGINALEGLGNKNAQSLFTLPAIFLGFILFLKYYAEKKVARMMALAIIMFFIFVSVFLSANRSGWLGLSVIAVVFILYAGISVRSIALALLVGSLVFVAIDRYAKDIVEHKRDQTLGGYASDRGRQQLAIQALLVGLENPVIGVGKDELHRQMATRLGLNKYGVEVTDSHNLWGYLFGATGILSMVAFLLFLWGLSRKYFSEPVAAVRPYVKKIRFLLIGFVVLYIIRALFTREILYSPTFMGGLGLMLGYYIYQIRYARQLLR